MNAQDVADYLQAHPEFFDQYADVLASLSLPNPHGGRAIPLSERQMMALRDKNKTLEMKLADLLRHGQENDAIVEKLHRWTRTLLLQRSARMLPDTLTSSLSETFSVPCVGLRIWEAGDDYADLACTQAVPVDVIAYANQSTLPYCGAPNMPHDAGLKILGEDGMQSIALIPLRRGASAEAFGMLALGSPDPRRFHAGMGTDFLARIGEIASAALTRLLG